jgi:hypothetical protein
MVGPCCFHGQGLQLPCIRHLSRTSSQRWTSARRSRARSRQLARGKMRRRPLQADIPMKIGRPSKWTTVSHALSVSAICWMASSGVSVASMTAITLSQLVQRSEVIVVAHKAPTSASAVRDKNGIVLFEITNLLKGDASINGHDILLCNPNNNSEWPDLSKAQGEAVFFVSRMGNCFSPIHGYRSEVGIQNETAWTAVIKEQPERQPATEFIQKIRSLVAVPR